VLDSLCCDICVRKRRKIDATLLSPAETDLLELITRIESRPSPPPPPQYSNDSKPRQKTWQKAVFDKLRSWRFEKWTRDYKHVSFPPQSLISDKMLKILATHTRIKTMDDLNIALPNWGWAEDFGPALLAYIKEVDSDWLSNQAREGEQKRVE
jgi:hypothetical protein